MFKTLGFLIKHGDGYRHYYCYYYGPYHTSRASGGLTDPRPPRVPYHISTGGGLTDPRPPGDHAILVAGGAYRPPIIYTYIYIYIYTCA